MDKHYKKSDNFKSVLDCFPSTPATAGYDVTRRRTAMESGSNVAGRSLYLFFLSVRSIVGMMRIVWNFMYEGVV